MSTVADLRPGDLVHLPGADVTGVFVAAAPHPRYPGLQLVVWRLSDGTWSHDALLAAQDIGQIQPAAGPERGARLLKACGG